MTEIPLDVAPFLCGLMEYNIYIAERQRSDNFPLTENLNRGTTDLNIDTVGLRKIYGFLC